MHGPQHQISIFTLFFLFVAICAGCDSLRGNVPERVHSYNPKLLLKTSVKSGTTATVKLQPPPGYHQAEETPDRVLTTGDHISVQRDGLTVVFSNARPGDRAWIEAYYCPQTDAGLCSFRPVEVLFTRKGPPVRVLSLPDPAG